MYGAHLPTAGEYGSPGCFVPQTHPLNGSERQERKSGQQCINPGSQRRSWGALGMGCTECVCDRVATRLWALWPVGPRSAYVCAYVPGAFLTFIGQVIGLWGCRGPCDRDPRAEGPDHQCGCALRACAGWGHAGMGVGTQRVSSTSALSANICPAAQCLHVLHTSGWDRAGRFYWVFGPRCEAGYAMAAPNPSPRGGPRARGCRHQPGMATFGEGVCGGYGNRAEIVPLCVADIPSRAQRRSRAERRATLPRVPVTGGQKMVFEVFEVTRRGGLPRPGEDGVWSSPPQGPVIFPLPPSPP